MLFHPCQIQACSSSIIIIPDIAGIGLSMPQLRFLDSADWADVSGDINVSSSSPLQWEDFFRLKSPKKAGGSSSSLLVLGGENFGEEAGSFLKSSLIGESPLIENLAEGRHFTEMETKMDNSRSINLSDIIVSCMNNRLAIE